MFEFQEYALTAVDMIARRMRIAFLNVQAADEILPKVIQIMGDSLGWDEERRKVLIYAFDVSETV